MSRHPRHAFYPGEYDFQTRGFRTFHSRPAGPIKLMLDDAPDDPPGPNRSWLFARQDGRCYLCGGPLDDGRKVNLDHVMPRSAGGRNARNLLLTHNACNSAKGNRMPLPGELAYLRRVYR